MVLTTAALRALSNQYKNAKITIFCSKACNSDFLKKYHFIKDIEEFNVYKLDSKGIVSVSFWRELVNVISKLRSNPIELIVNFHTPTLIDWFLIEFIVIAFSGAKFSIGANPYFLEKQSIYDRWISERELNGNHYKDFFLKIISLLGINPDNSDTEFPIQEEDRRYAEDFIKTHSLVSKRIICIHPASSEAYKIWPAERFKKVCAYFSIDENKIILVGSNADKSLGEIISKGNDNILDLVGKTSISQTAALIERCSVFIGNDSAPFHVAVAVKTPTIGLIGGGYPEFHLYNRADVRIIKKVMNCAPCRNMQCLETKCMRQIEVEEVVGAAETMLRKYNNNEPIGVMRQGDQSYQDFDNS